MTLDDQDPFEVDPEVLDPFLNGFFDTQVKAWQADLREPPYLAFLKQYYQNNLVFLK